MNFDIVVTQHPGLVKYLIKKRIIKKETEVTPHASPENITGKHVLGVLPHSLSCLTASFSEIPLAITPELRKKELSCEEVEKIAGELVTYFVEKRTNYEMSFGTHKLYTIKI